MRAYSPVDVFVSPSRFLADVMTRAGVFPERMRVVNHFVDVESTPVKDSAGGDLVFAGRLSHEKGVDLLIDAVGAMPDGRRARHRRRRPAARASSRRRPSG